MKNYNNNPRLYSEEQLTHLGYSPVEQKDATILDDFHDTGKPMFLNEYELCVEDVKGFAIAFIEQL